MDRERLDLRPAEWLAAAPNAVPPDKIAEVLATFSELPAVYRFTGPARLIRGTGADSKGTMARAYGGAFWVDERVFSIIDANLSQYVGWLSAKELASAERAKYRALTAVCEDWNDLREYHEMRVPEGETFDGLAGAIRKQPIQSKMDAANAKTPMLTGGFEQIFLKVRNPLWIYERRPL